VVLSEVVPVETIIQRVRELAPHAAVCVDGVAAAPHLALDCQAMDCDFYAYSHYKVFGPHMASLYGKKSAFAGLIGPNHFFIPDDAVPYKWELGCLPHELCAGRLAFKQVSEI
jgi:selenocysteine lyase/cysteine desulfurase